MAAFGFFLALGTGQGQIPALRHDPEQRLEPIGQHHALGVFAVGLGGRADQLLLLIRQRLETRQLLDFIGRRHQTDIPLDHVEKPGRRVREVLEVLGRQPDPVGQLAAHLSGLDQIRREQRIDSHNVALVDGLDDRPTGILVALGNADDDVRETDHRQR